MAAFVHPFSADSITEEEVINNKAFPLVRELAHKFGMKVIFASQLHHNGDRMFYMSRDDGIVMCSVYFDAEKESFAFRNSVSFKERGRSNEDKLTYTGKKVSFLMKTIEKQGMLPSTTTYMARVHGNMFRNVVRKFVDQFGEVRKSVMIDGESMHKIIEIALGNQPLSSLSRESMDKVQSVVDKYRHIDNMRVERREELNSYFNSHLRVLFYDDTGTFGVSKMMLRPEWSGAFSDTLEGVDVGIVEEFRRVKDPTEITEWIPTLAMLKTHLQQKNPNMEFVGESGFFPRSWEGHVPELQAVGMHGGDRWNRIAFGLPKFLIVPA
jgi:hypothetical protein